MPDEAPPTGDTPLLEGVRLFEPNDPPLPEAQGDRPVEGEVHLLDMSNERRQGATVGELRALGYPGTFPGEPPLTPIEEADDNALVHGWIADSQPEPGTVNLYVEESATPGGPAPENPTLSTIRPEPATAVSNPTPEQQGARTDEERQAADELAERAHELEDPNYQAGRSAALNGQPRSTNPNDGRRAEGRAWLRGWDAGQGAGLAPVEAPEAVEEPVAEEPAPESTPEEAGV